jgi:tetratricopeptide (TPR) repeat protein
MKLLTLAALSVGLGFSQTNDCDTQEKCEEALKANPRSSLPHFRLGEIHFLQDNFQNAANDFRDALNGDLDPRWIEASAHVNLGKIYDVADQRERAVNEYRLALKTNDNSHGALDEARRYTETRYRRN